MELVTSAMGIAKAIVNHWGNNAHNNASDAQDPCYLYREIPMPFVGDRTFMANANLIPTKIRTIRREHLIIGSSHPIHRSPFAAIIRLSLHLLLCARFSIHLF